MYEYMLPLIPEWLKSETRHPADIHRNTQYRRGAAAEDHAAQWRDIKIIAAECRHDMLAAGHAVVGGVEFHPAFLGAEEGDPGVRRVGAHQLLLARLGQSLDIARDIFRGNSHRPQAADLQVGEVLAHAFFVLQYIRQRSGDGAELRVVGELPENAAGEVGDTGFE